MRDGILRFDADVDEGVFGVGARHVGESSGDDGSFRLFETVVSDGFVEECFDLRDIEESPINAFKRRRKGGDFAVHEIFCEFFVSEVGEEGVEEGRLGRLSDDAEAALSGVSQHHEQGDGLRGRRDLPRGIDDELFDAGLPIVHEGFGQPEGGL